MNRLSIVFVATLAACLIAATAQDNHKPQTPPAKPGSPPTAAAPAPPAAANGAKAQFEQLKKLAGEWTAKAGSAAGGMDSDVKVVYKLTAGGSVMMETISPGTDHEMVTMYHMDGDNLVMSHYCVLGNQPQMKAEPSKDAKTITFTCNGHGGNMKSENDMHMHSEVITFVDDNHIKTAWTMYVDGKRGDDHKFELTRKTA